jgi:hypothetical protein
MKAICRVVRHGRKWSNESHPPVEIALVEHPRRNAEHRFELSITSVALNSFRQAAAFMNKAELKILAEQLYAIATTEDA